MSQIHKLSIFIAKSGKRCGIIISELHTDYVLVFPFTEDCIYGTTTASGEECRIPNNELDVLWIQATKMHDWFPQDVKNNMCFIHDKHIGCSMN